MQRFLPPHWEEMLSHVDQMVSRSGRSKAALQEARHLLSRAIEELMHGPFFMDGPGIRSRESLHLLRMKIHSANNAEEVRHIVSELQRLGLIASNAFQAREMEERIRGLEAQLKTMIEVPPPLGSEDSDEAKVITLEKLKDKRVLFAVMPFHEDFHDVWVGGIQRAASGTGLTPIRIDMIAKSSAITDDIVAAIDAAEIIVVDVTRNNPNVMFEFGFALARKKPHVVIAQSTEFLTFDIKDLRTITYRNSWKGIEELHKELQKFIKGTLGEKPKKRS